MECFNDGCIITGWTDGTKRRCPNNFSIPEKVEDLSVLAVSDSTFENCTTNGPLILPQTLNKIGARAFANTTTVTGIFLPLLTGLKKSVKRRSGAVEQMLR